MENSGKTSIKVLKGGPYLVSGDCEIIFPSGEIKPIKNASLCRCGLSKNKPFCDGSHGKSDFDK